MNAWLKLFVLSIGMSSICLPIRAEIGGSGRYELYSWKEGSDWNYALVPASKERRPDVEIMKQGGSPLRGSGQVKEKLIDMAEGDSISWQERADRGIVYPPDVVIQEIKDYAKAVGVKVSVGKKISQE